jgi:GT2 family glycosyltransferase
MEKVGIILVNYKDYAKKYLKDSYQSIINSDYKNWELLIVDNESSFETDDFLKKNAPEAKIIRNKNNDGFAKGNNDAMKYFLENKFPYILLLNMDAYLDPLAISELLKVIKEEENVAAVQARLMLDSDRQKINSLGNITNFLGYGYCSKYNQIYKEKNKLSDFIAYPSGAAVLLKSEPLKSLGLFDEKLWMYNEDQDLAWRFWLAGYSCKIAYNSKAYHKYEFSRSISKYYYMDRNRIIVAFKNYSLASLILFFPIFLITEIFSLVFAWRGAWLKEKIRVWFFFLSFKNCSYLFKARKKTQKLRKRKDHEIIKYFSGKISHQEIDHFIIKYIANPILQIYFLICRFLLKLLNF